MISIRRVGASRSSAWVSPRRSSAWAWAAGTITVRNTSTSQALRVARSGKMREVIAAVTARAHQAVLDGAPEGVDVRLLPDGLDAAVFVIAGGEPELTEALPRLEPLAVVQTLSAGTDWIEPVVPR